MNRHVDIGRSRTWWDRERARRLRYLGACIDNLEQQLEDATHPYLAAVLQRQLADARAQRDRYANDLFGKFCKTKSR